MSKLVASHVTIPITSVILEKNSEKGMKKSMKIEEIQSFRMKIYQKKMRRFRKPFENIIFRMSEANDDEGRR